MNIQGKTTIIDSDFRASAIFHGLSNAILLSFSISCTIVFSRLAEKSNTFDGVNVVAMAIISGIVTIVSLFLFLYTLYRVLKVSEQRDSIQQHVVQESEKVKEPEPKVENPLLRNLRDRTEKNQIKLPSKLTNITPRNIKASGFF